MRQEEQIVLPTMVNLPILSFEEFKAYHSWHLDGPILVQVIV